MSYYIHTPVGSDPIIEKFVNCMMIGGKKNISRKILNDCFEELKSKGHKNPKDAFIEAIQKTFPNVEVKPKRVGGAVYQVPMPVNEKRQLFLSISWILNAARKKKGMPMYKKLAIEINDALNDAGDAFKKKEEVQKMAQANKAFAHFAKR